MKLKLILITWCSLLGISNYTYAQIANYYSYGLHAQQYDDFLEDYKPFNEECYKQHTFYLQAKGKKMKMKAEEFYVKDDIGNREYEDYFEREFQIIDTLMPDNGATFHYKIAGTESRRISKPRAKRDSLNKLDTLDYSVLKRTFTGTMYGFKFNYNDLLANSIANGDLYFKITYNDDKKVNFYHHLNKLTIAQIEDNKIKAKEQEELSIAQAEQRKREQLIYEQEKAERQRRNAEEWGKAANTLINSLKKN